MRRGQDLKFECLFCEDCCYFEEEDEMPVVFEDENERLLSLRKDLEFKQIGKGRFRWIIKGYCPFFDREAKRCKIHEIKPLACKMFPVFITDDGEFAISDKCRWVREHPEIKNMPVKDVLLVFENEFRSFFERFLK